MKIAYLHGLESTIDKKDPKIIFMNKTFDEVYAPSINYKDPATFNRLFNDIKKLQPDLIVGSSMGGYVSYLIGSKLSIETILFNPAMVGRSFDPIVDNSSLRGSTHNVYSGKNDKVIDGEAVKKYFNEEGVGNFKYNSYNGEHRVPSDVFISAIKNVLKISEINNITKNKNNMKRIKLFEEFINEASYVPTNLNDADESSQLDYIKRNSKYETAMDKIENPSEKVQLAAVKSNPQELKFIKDPSEKVQITAVSVDSYKFKNTTTPIDANFDNAIQYIKNPSEKVQIAAISKFGSAIKHIEKPSEKIKMMAIENDPASIRHIENPSEELQIAAVSHPRPNGSIIIANIENPTPKVQLIAIQKNPYILKDIKNPTDEVKALAK